MDLKKNDEIVVTIDNLGNQGEGVAHVDGYALFIKKALPGEKVLVRLMKLNKNYGFARLVEILEASPQRVEPACPMAKTCGGCSLQHLSYEGQLAFKEQKVRDCLKRIGGVEPPIWEPILGMTGEEKGKEIPVRPWNYRNKAQFPVREDESGNPAVGFFANRSHRLIPVENCAIQHPVINEVVEEVLGFMRECHIPAYQEEKHSGLVRHIYVRRGYHTGQIMVCLIINGKSLPHSEKLVQRLKKVEGMTSISLNVNTKKTNVILGEKMIWLEGAPYIEDTIGDIRYRISPQSFYQVNPIQTEKLYRTALEFADLHGDENVWDLYCGIGTISLFLAQRAKHVTGVEIVPEAVENARENAKLNGITNAEFYCGAAEEVAGKLIREEGQGQDTVDVVVVDPPRKGCDSTLLDTIVKMQPKRVVYVSCDPATLARDVKILGEKGYRVEKARACDMFSQGEHVETVVQLVNIGVKPDYTVRLEVDVDEFYKTVGEDKRDYLDSEEYKKIKAKNKDK